MRAEPKRLAMVCLSFRLDALTEPATHSTGSAGQARCSETVAGSARHQRVTRTRPRSPRAGAVQWPNSVRSTATSGRRVNVVPEISTGQGLGMPNERSSLMPANMNPDWAASGSLPSAVVE